MIYFRHFLSIWRHKWYVFLAGLRIGGIPLWRLIIHDWSKLAPSEFFPYARRYQGGVDNRLEWGRAWHHHLRLNPHHASHYVLSWSGQEHFYKEVAREYCDYIVILPMPETYVREMVADLLGASMSYTGSWDMTEWLNQNVMGILNGMHSDSQAYFKQILSTELGYRHKAF